MSSINYISKIINLKGFCVKKVNDYKNCRKIYGQMELKEHKCPCCGHMTSKVHDYRTQEIKDISAFGYEIYIVIRKRRYVCTHCNKRFTEKIPFLSKYQRMTKRLIYLIIEKLKDVSSYTHTAKEMNVSVSTVIRIFDNVNYTKPELPEVIGIDEFKGNTGGEKYQCIITDIKNKKVIDILPVRYENYLVDYFKPCERKNTKYFVSDMWVPYANIAKTYFKKAVYITDKYHFVRQVTWAFEAVRKEEQKRFIKEKRKLFKRSRSLLLKRYSELNEESRQAVAAMLNASEKLYSAYILKENFYDIMKSKNKEEAEKEISVWIMAAENSGLDRFIKCAGTMRKWIDSITNAFDCSYTNGFTEGSNNKIKVLKRNAYGFRNFRRFRNRILHIFA